MRRELNHDLFTRGYGEFLLYFGKMPVLGNSVSPHAFIALHEKIIDVSLAPGTTDAAERIRDDSSRFNQFGAEQGKGRQENARWITTGRRNEGSVLDLLAIH